jgi:hypothetical protein
MYGILTALREKPAEQRAPQILYRMGVEGGAGPGYKSVSRQAKTKCNMFRTFGVSGVELMFLLHVASLRRRIIYCFLFWVSLDGLALWSKIVINKTWSKIVTNHGPQIVQHKYSNIVKKHVRKSSTTNAYGNVRLSTCVHRPMGQPF